MNVQVTCRDSGLARARPVNIPGAWVTSDQTITTAGQVFVLPITPKRTAGLAWQLLARTQPAEGEQDER